MERYVLRGGRWGYDRLQMLARARRSCGSCRTPESPGIPRTFQLWARKPAA